MCRQLLPSAGRKERRKPDTRPDGLTGTPFSADDGSVAIVKTTLRIESELLEVAKVEAAAQEVSLNTYLVSAVIARSSFDYARRGGEGVELLDRLQRHMLRVARDYFGAAERQTPPTGGSGAFGELLPQARPDEP